MRKLPLLMVIASVLAGLGVVQMTFLIGQAAYRAVTWSNESRDLRREIEGLQQDVRTLQDMQARTSDPTYLRELARCQGFVGASETVVVDEAAKVPQQGNCEPVQAP